MSLFAQRNRIEVSPNASEVDSFDSSETESAEMFVEELARMALAGCYGAGPSMYETSALLQGRGRSRRPINTWEARLDPKAYSGTSGESTAAARSTSAVRPLTGLGEHHLCNSGDWRGEDNSASEARALAKMYRHLAREYLSDPEAGPSPVSATAAQSRVVPFQRAVAVGDAKQARGSPSTPAEAKATGKPQRKSDLAARARLYSKGTKSGEGKSETYEHRKAREEEEARRRTRRKTRVSAEAVARGTRLFLEARRRANAVRTMQEEQIRQRAREEEKCTFQPTISALAERLAADGAYVPLAMRFKERSTWEEERQRRRLERAVQMEKENTFHPRLSARTVALVEQGRRSHHRRPHRRSSPSHRCGSSPERHGRNQKGLSRSSSTHEPFEPGERLYRDGGDRLLRQQVRQQRAVAKQQSCVVGGRLRLSRESAQQLIDRFHAWATSREEHREDLRTSLEHQEKTRQGAARFRKGEPQPSLTTLRCTPMTVSKAPQKQQGEEVRERSEAQSAVSTSPPQSGAQLAACTTKPLHPYYDRCSSETRSSRAPSGRSTGRSSEAKKCWNVALHGAAPSSPRSPTLSANGRPIQKEELRIRLGALFYKYAVSPSSSTVSLAQVRQRIEAYYPEDTSIVAALTCSFPYEAQQAIGKLDFMAALAQYVAQHGIQPWCLPHSLTLGDDVEHDRPKARGQANAGLVEASDDRIHGRWGEGGAAPAVPSPPPPPPPPPLVSGSGEAPAQLCAALRKADGCIAKVPPLRTHIYSASQCEQLAGDSDVTLSSVLSSSASAGGNLVEGVARSTRNIDAYRTKLPAPDLVPSEERKGNNKKVIQKEPRSSSAVALRVGVTERGGCGRSGRSHPSTTKLTSATSPGTGDVHSATEDFTFRPALNGRSIALSNRDLRRRLANIGEGPRLRKGAPSNAPGTVATPVSQQSNTDPATYAERLLARAAPQSPVRRRTSASPAAVSPVSDGTPAVELSSLSSSPLQPDVAGVSVPQSLPLGGVEMPKEHHRGVGSGDATRRAIADLEQLLGGVTGSSQRL